MRAIPLVVLFLLLVNSSLAAPAYAKPGETEGAEGVADVNPERYFAVTLRSSFTPISDKQAKREITDRPVYLIQSRAFGKNVYNLRVGFFGSFRDASAYRNNMLARYPAAVVTEVSRNEYASIQRTTPMAKPAVPPVEAARVTPAIPVPAAPGPAASPAPPATTATVSPRALYVIQLEETAKPISAARAPLPAAFKNNRLYVTQAGDKDKLRYQLKLGFFEKEQEVFAARQQLKTAYPNAKVTRITLKEQNDSARLALAEPTAPTLAAPAVPTAPTSLPPARPAPATPPAMLPSVAALPATPGDKDALALMDKARTALARGDNRAAVVTLDKLLRMPPNRFSQDAQEFIGLARERSGETVAARKEYELYLRLYPAGEGADRVRQRIAALDATVPSPVLKAAKPRAEVLSTIIGSLSQHYYHGASKVDTTELIPTAGSQNQATLTQTDQSALVTNLNLTHRYRSENYDNRFVIRDTHTKNFLKDQDDENRLSALYYEIKDRKRDYSARLGRQPGSSGGVLGRFDGATAGYNFTPKWRVNVVGGKPSDNAYDTDLKFYGASMDLGPFAEHWGGSLYTMQQKADEVVDRNAVGGELRYFSPAFTVYGLYDYDTEFATANIILLQGNWTGGSGTSAHVLFDKRRTPSLTLTNALLGETDTSIQSQLQTRSYEQLKQQALDVTPTTDMISLGVSQALGTRWQLGFDVQSAHTSAYVGTVNYPGQADTGDIHTYTGNVIGTGLFTQRDVNVLSVSRIDAPNYTGNSYSLTNRLLWGSSWGLDITLSWYSQDTTTPVSELERFSPVIRPSYKWKENITFEAEFGEERTNTTTATTEEKNVRRYWSLGYRWDF